MSLPLVVAGTALAALALSPTALFAQALPVPVHWYRGDGDPTDAIGGMDGVAMNGLSYASGFANQAFNFDEISSYVALPPAVSPTGDFSVEVYVQFDTLPTGFVGDVAIVQDAQPSNGPGWRLLRQISGSKFWVLTQTSGGSFAAQSTTTVMPGVPYHVVATFENWTTALGTVRLYVDGVLEGTGNVAPSYNPTPDLRIGANLSPFPGNPPTEVPDGQIDEVRFYGYALSAAEVAQLHAAGAGAPPGCEFEWLATDGNGVDDTAYAATALPGGGAVVGGDFLQAGGQPASRIAAFDGVAWSPLGGGMDGRVSALATRSNGNVVAGGAFTTAGGAAVRNIAEWDGVAWQALGPPVGDGTVADVVVLPNGDVVAGGSFSQIGGVAASRVARWDGSAWSAMTPAPTGDIDALLALPNGDVLAAGLGVGDGVRRWDGSTWQSFATPLNGPIYCMTRLANGDFVVGGNFTGAPSQAGVLLNRIARWDGSSWQPLGNGMPFLAVYALESLSGVEVIAAGEFSIAGSATASSVARWDGAAWFDVDGGVTGAGLFQQCWDITTLANDDLLAVGGFTTAGVVSTNVNRVAIADVRCSPAVSTTQPTCVTAAGTCRLLANTLPKAGTTFERVASGLPAPSVVFGLTSILPASGPVPLFVYGPSPVGCDLLVNPVVVELIAVGGGTVAWNLNVPGDLGFVGLPLEQQVLAIEVSAQGLLTQLAGTNALSATIGGL